MWEKVERSKSKEVEPQPFGAKPETKKPSQPDRPKDPSKPPYPYTMSPSEARQYRWRWVEASAGNLDDEEIREAVKYAIEVIRSNSIKNVGEFVSQIERDLDKQAARRDAYRRAIYRR